MRLGGDQVGYRIGMRKHYTSATQVVFATAGVLLEDIKGQGAAALLRYKIIILDEVCPLAGVLEWSEAVLRI